MKCEQCHEKAIVETEDNRNLCYDCAAEQGCCPHCGEYHEVTKVDKDRY